LSATNHSNYSGQKPVCLGMRKWSYLLVLLFASTLAKAQLDPNNLSGIINKYYKVVAVDTAKDYVVVIDTTGLFIYQQVMLIQMKGASINTTNNSSYGTVTSRGRAGKYELNTICAIRKGTLPLRDTVFLQKDMLETYQIDSAVQLVGIPDLTANTTTITGLVSALPWDSTSGLGGVVAMYCGDLTLQADIDASAKGYKGGTGGVCPNSCTNPFIASTYVSNANVDGAVKGEGIAKLGTNTRARGANANGGGGGNNFDNGGAGGSNLKIGGNGGRNNSTAGCTGAVYGNNAVGGKALDSTGSRIFMGGGGGEGYADTNPLGSFYNGGNGGGIVYVQANQIIGNGHKIMANGGEGGEAIGDGSGGGGGGGTIIIDIVGNGSADVVVEAKGGKGGNANANFAANRCYGAGGGGGGGVVYYTQATAPASFTNSYAGGANGVMLNTNGCGAGSGIQAGTIGEIRFNYDLPRGVAASNYCAEILPINLLHFSALQKNGQVLLQWQSMATETGSFVIERSADGNQWQALGTLTALLGNRRYQHSDIQPLVGKNLYRLRMVQNRRTIGFSNILLVFMNPQPNQLLITPNPANNHFVVYTSSPGRFTLTNANGQIVLQKSLLTNSTIVNATNLHNGLYIASIDGIAQKLIIAH
jgi:hypothetical protein